MSTAKDQINNSAIKMINLLFNGRFERDEIADKLNISTAGFYKSLKKIRQAGFNIDSNNELYNIWDFNQKLTLTDYDISILARMLVLGWTFLPEQKTDTFINLLRQVLLYAQNGDFDKVISRYKFFKKLDLTYFYKEKIAILKEYIINRTKIKVTLRSGRIIEIIPIKIDCDKEKICLYYDDIGKNLQDKTKQKKRKHSIRIDKIAKITKIDDQLYIAGKNEVIFELYGNLADSYLLKQDERIISNSKDVLTIASGAKNREMLFKRLMRYDTLCKVVFPQKDIKFFNNMIERALNNINA